MSDVVLCHRYRFEKFRLSPESAVHDPDSLNVIRLSSGHSTTTLPLPDTFQSISSCIDFDSNSILDIVFNLCQSMTTRNCDDQWKILHSALECAVKSDQNFLHFLIARVVDQRDTNDTIFRVNAKVGNQTPGIEMTAFTTNPPVLNPGGYRPG